MRKVIIGGIYKHFKGHIYKVLLIAKDSDDLKDLVIYQNEETKEIWVRSKEEFLSKVDKDKYPDCLQQYRFEKINENI